MTKIQSLTKIAIAIVITASVSSCAVTPKVITPQQRNLRIEQDWENMFQGQEAINSPLNIYQAMARAIKYNLDIRVKSMEIAYAMADAKYTASTMLPSIIASAGYTGRNNSYSVLSPSTPGTISTTEDRNQTDANLQFSWNALDFGVSYIESKQKANLYLIAQERKRKIIQQVIRDTRYAYWRALAAQEILVQVNGFRGEIHQAISQSQQAGNEKLTSPTDAAYYRSELWEQYRNMTLLQDQLSNAQPELLAMINLKPGSKVTLADPTRYNIPLPANFPKDVNTLELMALQNRPELREEDYRNKISLEEINKARLKMLPNLGLNAGEHYDSNSFLVNNSWADWGSQLSWDILRVFSKYHGIQVAKAEEQVGDVRRMALSMAVITQVDIAKLRYQEAVMEVQIAKNLRDARYQYYMNLVNEQKADLTDNLVVINAKAKWLVAKLAYYTTYAEWQNAAGQLLDSVGYDPLNSVASIDVPVNTLAQQIQLSMSRAPIPSGTMLTMQAAADALATARKTKVALLKSGWATWRATPSSAVVASTPIHPTLHARTPDPWAAWGKKPIKTTTKTKYHRVAIREKSSKNNWALWGKKKTTVAYHHAKIIKHKSNDSWATWEAKKQEKKITVAYHHAKIVKHKSSHSWATWKAKKSTVTKTTLASHRVKIEKHKPVEQLASKDLKKHVIKVSHKIRIARSKPVDQLASIPVMKQTVANNDSKITKITFA